MAQKEALFCSQKMQLQTELAERESQALETIRKNKILINVVQVYETQIKEYNKNKKK